MVQINSIRIDCIPICIKQKLTLKHLNNYTLTQHNLIQTPNFTIRFYLKSGKISVFLKKPFILKILYGFPLLETTLTNLFNKELNQVKGFKTYFNNIQLSGNFHYKVNFELLPSITYQKYSVFASDEAGVTPTTAIFSNQQLQTKQIIYLRISKNKSCLRLYRSGYYLIIAENYQDFEEFLDLISKFPIMLSQEELITIVKTVKKIAAYTNYKEIIEEPFAAMFMKVKEKFCTPEQHSMNDVASFINDICQCGIYVDNKCLFKCSLNQIMVKLNVKFEIDEIFDLKDFCYTSFTAKVIQILPQIDKKEIIKFHNTVSMEAYDKHVETFEEAWEGIFKDLFVKPTNITSDQILQDVLNMLNAIVIDQIAVKKIALEWVVFPSKNEQNKFKVNKIKTVESITDKPSSSYINPRKRRSSYECNFSLDIDELKDTNISSEMKLPCADLQANKNSEKEALLHDDLVDLENFFDSIKHPQINTQDDCPRNNIFDNILDNSDCQKEFCQKNMMPKETDGQKFNQHEFDDIKCDMLCEQSMHNDLYLSDSASDSENEDTNVNSVKSTKESVMKINTFPNMSVSNETEELQKYLDDFSKKFGAWSNKINLSFENCEKDVDIMVSKMKKMYEKMEDLNSKFLKVYHSCSSKIASKLEKLSSEVDQMNKTIIAPMQTNCSKDLCIMHYMNSVSKIGKAPRGHIAGQTNKKVRFN